jgi:hypothetical protein
MLSLSKESPEGVLNSSGNSWEECWQGTLLVLDLYLPILATFLKVFGLEEAGGIFALLRIFFAFSFYFFEDFIYRFLPEIALLDFDYESFLGST